MRAIQIRYVFFCALLLQRLAQLELHNSLETPLGFEETALALPRTRICILPPTGIPLYSKRPPRPSKPFRRQMGNRTQARQMELPVFLSIEPSAAEDNDANFSLEELLKSLQKTKTALRRSQKISDKHRSTAIALVTAAIKELSQAPTSLINFLYQEWPAARYTLGVLGSKESWLDESLLKWFRNLRIVDLRTRLIKDYQFINRLPFVADLSIRLLGHRKYSDGIAYRSLLEESLYFAKSHYPKLFEFIVLHTTVIELKDLKDNYGESYSHKAGHTYLDPKNAVHKVEILTTLFEEAIHHLWSKDWEISQQLIKDSKFKFEAELAVYGQDHSVLAYIQELHIGLVLLQILHDWPHGISDDEKYLQSDQEFYKERNQSILNSLRSIIGKDILTAEGEQLVSELDEAIHAYASPRSSHKRIYSRLLLLHAS